MRLSEFRALMLSKLLEISKQLKEKYNDKRDKIDHITNTLVVKLQQLRKTTLTDYIFTLYMYSKEFKELEELIPDHETIKKLLEDAE